MWSPQCGKGGGGHRRQREVAHGHPLRRADGRCSLCARLASAPPKGAVPSHSPDGSTITKLGLPVCLPDFRLCFCGRCRPESARKSYAVSDRKINTGARHPLAPLPSPTDRKSAGKGKLVYVRVDLVGPRTIKKKKNKQN